SRFTSKAAVSRSMCQFKAQRSMRRSHPPTARRNVPWTTKSALARLLPLQEIPAFRVMYQWRCSQDAYTTTCFGRKGCLLLEQRDRICNPRQTQESLAEIDKIERSLKQLPCEFRLFKAVLLHRLGRFDGALEAYRLAHDLADTAKGWG